MNYPDDISTTEIRTAVINIIMERTNLPFAGSSKLVEDLGFDSLMMVDLTMALEDKFAFRVDYVPDRMQTVNDVVLFMQSLMDGGATPQRNADE